MTSNTKFNKYLRGRVGAALLTALLSACASPPKSLNIEETEVITATVEAVDVRARLLALRVAEGETITVIAAPQVQNLPQVKVGDRVEARYYQALAAELRRRADGSGDVQPPVIETSGGHAVRGARPSGVVGIKTQQTVRITWVDTDRHRVGFYGSDGFNRSIPVQTPQAREFIRELKAGDEVELTFTEALAVSVEAPK
jgi:hypothetical protein